MMMSGLLSIPLMSGLMGAETSPYPHEYEVFYPQPDWPTKKRLIDRRQDRLLGLLDELGKLPSQTRTTMTEEGMTTDEVPMRPEFRMTRKPGVHGSYRPGTLPGQNRIFWDLESVHNNWPHFYEQTMPHEIAHAGTSLSAGGERQGHTEEWDELMKRLIILLRGPDEKRVRNE